MTTFNRLSYNSCFNVLENPNVVAHQGIYDRVEDAPVAVELTLKVEVAPVYGSHYW